MEIFIVLTLLIAAYLMVIAKRLSALIRSFRQQAFLLFLFTLLEAVKTGSIGLYVVSGLLFVLKVIVVPHYLTRIARTIKINENLGLFINPQLSLVLAMVITYFCYVFSRQVFGDDLTGVMFLAASLTVTFIGMFLVVFRMRALSQVIGILVMENGLFLLASTISGGMPFFVEIAIFFDVFLSVVISAIFIYRINKVFTHVDVDKLKYLRG